MAQDLDATTNNIHYRLSSDDAGSAYDGPFEIDIATGVVRVKAGYNPDDLDNEINISQSFYVQASSEDGSVSYQSFTVNIRDINEFDVSAVRDVNDAPNMVSEDANIGSTVGINGYANDDDRGDSVSYRLLNASDNSVYDGPFTIDANGVVTISAPLDAETATEHHFRIEATSTDGSTSVSSVQTVTVFDANEFAVSDIADSNIMADVIDEYARAGAQVGITATAADFDLTDSAVTFSLRCVY